MTQDSFLGYHRANGQVGVRNHLLVLSTGGLTGQTARRIGRALPGSVTVTLGFNTGLVGRDLRVHRAAITGFANHPNVGAALLIGDNPVLMAEIAAQLAHTKRRFVTAGERLRMQNGPEIIEVVAREPIALCHKISLSPLRAGAPVIKYRYPIGETLAAIPAGHHVHVHNMRSARAKAGVAP